MKTLLTFMKSTLIGGAIFILPIGIVALALAEVFEIAHAAGAALRAEFFPSFQGEIVLAVAASLLIILAAFNVGLFARTRLGVGMSGRIERSIVGQFPLYPMVRQMLVDMAGGVGRLERQGVKVVRVQRDSMTVFGFLMEAGEAEAVVFFPNAPSAFSGSVAVLALDQIEPTNLSVTDVLNAMRDLGIGLAGASRR